MRSGQRGGRDPTGTRIVTVRRLTIRDRRAGGAGTAIWIEGGETAYAPICYNAPMDQIKEFTDDRLKAWCIHCGQGIDGLETNRDHVPSKSLLQMPYPDNLPVVQVCRPCNSSFAPHEEYLAAFLGVVLAGSTDPHRQTNANAARILQGNVKLCAQIEKAKSEYRTHGGDTHFVWKPELESINRVVLKNARGHAFYEFGEPMLESPTHVWSAPLAAFTAGERAEFEHVDLGPGWPEVGSRMMTRVMTGQDLFDGWIIVQDGVYRYAVAQTGAMIVRTVLFEYLATEVYWED